MGNTSSDKFYKTETIRLESITHFVQPNGYSFIVDVVKRMDDDDVLFLKKIVEKRININQAHHETGNTALHYMMKCSVWGGMFNTFARLKADINTINNKGETPMDTYIKKNGIWTNTYPMIADMIAHEAAYNNSFRDNNEGWRHIVCLMNKNTILHMLAAKLKCNGDKHVWLPIELIRILHDILCKNIVVDDMLFTFYKMSKSGKLL